MFQTVEPRQIFDPRYWQVSEDHPAYWLAQLRKADWQALLAHLPQPVRMPRATKPVLAKAALEHFEFEVCPGRNAAWLAWLSLQKSGTPGLVVQFRHSETDWTRGIPEFVHPDKGETLGFVNIATRLVCRLKP